MVIRYFTAFPDTRTSAPSTYAAASYSSLTGAGRYSVPYTVTAAGTYQVSVFQNLKSGLLVEVFSNSGFRSAPTFSCLDADVNYEWRQQAIAPSCAENAADFATDFVSIRWTGFVLLDVVETVTFFVETASAAEGIDGARLWVGGIMLVDSTVADEIRSGTFNVAASSMYSVLLEYKATTGKFLFFIT
jgi:hypothetical protein